MYIIQLRQETGDREDFWPVDTFGPFTTKAEAKKVVIECEAVLKDFFEHEGYFLEVIELSDYSVDGAWNLEKFMKDEYVFRNYSEWLEENQ